MNSDTSNQSAPQQENFFIEIIKFAFIAALIVIPFRVFIAEPYIVQGASMSPTYETGHYLIIDKLSHKVDQLDRGTVIVFEYPNDPSRFFVKRVIGLPGETVRVQDGTVSIKTTGGSEFQQLDEIYIAGRTQGSSDQVLTNSQYFVMGDNRSNSSDSRFWGPLEQNLIKGRSLVRLYPFNKIALLPGTEHPTLPIDNQ